MLDSPPPIAARQNARRRSFVSSLVGFVAVAALARVLYARRAELGHALDVDVASLALLGALALAAQGLRAFEFQFMLRRLGVDEPYRHSLLSTGAAQLLNYLPFSAGSVARAVALRERHALDYPAYVSALLVAALVSGAVSSGCGLAAALALPTPSLPLVALFGAALVGSCGALALVTYRMPEGSSRLHAALKRFERGAAFLRSRDSVRVLAGTSLVRLALSTARLAICYRAFGEAPSLPGVVLLGSAGVIVSLVNLTPGNLGIRELALGALSAALGGSPEHGMAAASLERAVTLACALLVGLPGLAHLRTMVSRRAASDQPPPSPP